MEHTPIARSVQQYASYTTMEGQSATEPDLSAVPQQTMEEWIADRSVAEIKALVANKTLTAEEVYKAEKAGKARGTILSLYGPKSEEKSDPTEGLADKAE